MTTAGRGRIGRLAEELAEAGYPVGSDERSMMLLDEVDYAQRPPVHERRVPSTGTVLDPTTPPPTWQRATGLTIGHLAVDDQPLSAARRFADGRSTWLLRRQAGPSKWLLFDRPSGSERDLVVLADGLGATIVQRATTGTVRVVGPHGVFRWEGLTWHHERPIRSWLRVVTGSSPIGHLLTIEALITFAVHDLGARGIGSLLIHAPDDGDHPPPDERLPSPPELSIVMATHLAPLRHALGQLDGAAFFDVGGTLRHLGVRLVPSQRAEESVSDLWGTRHTSARRYSFDAPTATVIAVSEDGPVSVLRGGDILASSGPV